MAFSIYAQQQYDPVSDFNFKVFSKDGGESIVITRYKGSKQIVRIPPRIKGLPVIIGEGAFAHCTNLTSVTFEGTITLDNFGCHDGYREHAFEPIYYPFNKDLHNKYLAGGAGTYTKPNGESGT
jgi:hypothetical protein